MESSSVMALLPVKNIGVTNIMLGNQLVKFGYLIKGNIQLPFKNYFKVSLSKDNIRQYLRILLEESYTQYSNILCYNKDAKLKLFIENLSETSDPVSLVLPILNLSKVPYSINNLSNAILMFGVLVSSSDTLIQDFLNKVSPSIFRLSYKNMSIYIDGNPVDSPCSLCKLNAEKIGDLCMYKTQSYECLFNCEKGLPIVTEPNNYNYVKTSELETIDNFEERKILAEEYVKEIESKYNNNKE